MFVSHSLLIHPVAFRQWPAWIARTGRYEERRFAVEHVLGLRNTIPSELKSKVSTGTLDEPIGDKAIPGGYLRKWLTLLRWWTVSGNSWNRSIPWYLRPSRRLRPPYEDWS
jgi:hypothetical protein